MQTDFPPAALDVISRTSRQLSKFSYSAGGIADVIGGTLALTVALAHGFNLLTPTSRVVFFTFPFIWIAAKELIRRRYYQKFGKITEPIPEINRIMHIVGTVFVAVVGLIIAGLVWTHVHTAGQSAYVATALAMPIVTWLFLRRPIEFIIGIMMMCQSAVAIAGGRYPFAGVINPPVIIPIFVIIFGIAAHLQFLAAVRRMRKFNSELAKGAL